MKRKNFLAMLIAIISFLLYLPSNNGIASAEEYLSSEKVQNLVVFLTFDQEHSFKENFEEDIYKMYETSSISVKNYLLYQSRDKLELSTQILKQKNGDMCVRSTHSVNYYKPRYQWSYSRYYDVNPEGYDNRYFDENGSPVAPQTVGSKVHIDASYREQLLLTEIVEALDIDRDYKSDLNGDNYVDSFVIISDFSADSSWGNILWPHMGNSRSFTEKLINYYYYEPDKKEEYQSLPLLKLGQGYLSAYNLISASSITASKVGNNNNVILNEERDLYNVGILAHEMMHTLGLADYYSYENFSYESVGEFDLMGTTTVVPQNMLGYLRLKMGWLDYSDVLYINDSGEYTLPLTYEQGKPTIAKIILSDYHQTGDYFMLEFRSKSLATLKDPFDCELSGDGLIIYRVNTASAYYNSAGDLGNTDYGNMYGKDEVYVYRVGNPNATKVLNSPLGLSYALLGGKQESISVLAGGKYNTKTYGNADKSKTADTLISSDLNDSETALLYSDGKNSGIVLSNVTVDEKAKCVKFNLSLPEKQSSMPILTAKSTKISKFLDGNNYLLWDSDVKSGKAHLLAIRSTDRLKRLAETGKSGITINDFKNADFKHYDTVYSASVPLAEKSIKLPEFETETLLFIAFESQTGSCAVRYVGSVEGKELSFGQFLYKTIDKIYYVYFASFIILITFLFVLVYYRKRIANKFKKR